MYSLQLKQANKQKIHCEEKYLKGNSMEWSGHKWRMHREWNQALHGCAPQKHQRRQLQTARMEILTI